MAVIAKLDWTLEKQQREAEAEAEWQLNLPHDICSGRAPAVTLHTGLSTVITSLLSSSPPSWMERLQDLSLSSDPRRDLHNVKNGVETSRLRFHAPLANDQQNVVNTRSPNTKQVLPSIIGADGQELFSFRTLAELTTVARTFAHHNRTLPRYDVLFHANEPGRKNIISS
ncbi:unnamed protein product [Pleuronectes platessa]|uniref:Uncharacterized protein n=1 Tax=Pleuronectes platessa TaxID=8262 RepID=A0A9N7U0R9_PLEPL|nr:unnamed protein product [Pleuronectes platessa]